jgi:DNA-binding transcriptional LysR family regulator
MPINLGLRHYRAFVAIARSGSFRVAADNLRISQPALSVAIRQMEEKLDLTLFNRTTRRVELTPIGADFLPMAERVLRDFEASATDIRSAALRKRGRVIVACLPSIGVRFMPEILNRFRIRHPDYAVQILDDATKDMMVRVARNEADFCISSNWRIDQELRFAPILEDHYVAVLPRAHALAGTPSIRWKEIIDQPFIAMAQGTHTRELMDAALSKKRMAVYPFYIASQIQTIVGLVEAGMGVSALPEKTLPVRMQDRIAISRLTDPAMSRMIGFTTSRHRPLPAAAGSFMEICREVMQEAGDFRRTERAGRPGKADRSARLTRPRGLQ